MAQDDDQRRVKDTHAELDGTQHFRTGDMPGGAHHEQVAQATVEDYLGGQPGIGASEQHGERLLGRCGLGAAGGALVRVLGGARDEAQVGTLSERSRDPPSGAAAG